MTCLFDQGLQLFASLEGPQTCEERGGHMRGSAGQLIQDASGNLTLPRALDIRAVEGG